MKLRNDYVTNSSSSSFIISRDDITRGHLLDVLLEMANEEAKHWYDSDDDDLERYDWDDVNGHGVGHFRIKEYIDEPYVKSSWTDSKDEEFYNVFVVDNEDCGRYNWDVVEEVLERHGLRYQAGYCD